MRATARRAHELTLESVPTAGLRTFHKNPRQGNVAVLVNSLRVNGQYKPIVVNRGTHTGRECEVLAGNHTLIAAREAGWEDISVVWVDVDEDHAARIVAADNRVADLGTYDEAVLADLLGGLPSLEGTGYADSDLAALLGGADADSSAERRRTLAERFGVPPFSVLDARQGYWRERKQAWLGLGLRSEVGRGADLLDLRPASRLQAATRNGPERQAVVEEDLPPGTSVFDPVLTELLVRWYSAPGHVVLDPFAGGSVRGLLAAHLGRSYVGVDLRQEQVTANEEAAEEWAGNGLLPAEGPAPRWLVGDSRQLGELLPAEEPAADLLLTCPPYFDLEVYSDDPADLSRAADYPAFLELYGECLAAASARMAPNAFAAIVTGAVRDKRGMVLDLPADTTRIMERLGWRLYQDAMLITPVGSASVRAARYFTALRKLVRVHQSVAVYHRGELERVRDWPSAEAGEVAEPSIADPEPGT